MDKATLHLLNKRINMMNKNPILNTEVDHLFWKDQPVPQTESECRDNCEIADLKNTMDLETIPSLPHHLIEWSEIDVNNTKCFNELCELIDKYYVEDSDDMFRLNYSKEFIKWYMSGPGFHSELLVGIRFIKTGTLVGFISGKIINTILSGKSVPMAEINFLCLNTTLRKKGYADVLIKEITRRVVKLGYNQAMFTGGRSLPTPISNVPIYHRIINYEKAVDTGFCLHTIDQNVDFVHSRYQIPNLDSGMNMIKMTEDNVEKSHKLYLEQMESSYEFYHKMTFEEFKYTFFNNNTVTTYTVLDKENNVTDMISYYRLDGKVLSKISSYDKLNCVYLYYYTTINNSIYSLFSELLQKIRTDNIDIINLFDLMENRFILNDFMINPGDGKLNYYLYNWKTWTLPNNSIGKITL